MPRNLRIAAGLGRLDLIRELVRRRRSLSEAAGAARGFYRPHTGFPIWQPSDDPQEILDEALVWAAKSDRVDVLGPLVELGADADGDPYRGTALIWAAAAATSPRSRGWSSSAPTRAARPRSAGPITGRA